MATTQAPLPPTPPPSRSFVFINDTNPDDAKSKTKRKLVRAQAARGPHSNTHNGMEKTEKSLQTISDKHQQLKRGKKGNGTTTIPLSVVGLEDLGPAPYGKAPETTHKSRPIIVQVEDVGLESADEEIPAPTKRPSRPSTVKTTSHTLSHTGSKPSDDEASPSSGSNTAVIPKMPGTGWVAPFISHPEPTRPYIPLILDHYLKNMATEIPELDCGSPFSIRNKWYPMAITSPATLYVVLLTSASHYVVSNSFLNQPKMQRVLLELKQACLTSINNDIRATPATEMMPDTVIGAVCKMASYEAMFGSGTLYHTHMRGLQNMIQQRGGLGKLAKVLDGLLMRLILWVDINSAFILNSEPYFTSTTPLAGNVATVEKIEPDPMGFLCNIMK